MSTTAMPHDNSAPGSDSQIKRSYVRVLVVWLLTLLALYAFQEYFS